MDRIASLLLAFALSAACSPGGSTTADSGGTPGSGGGSSAGGSSAGGSSAGGSSAGGSSAGGSSAGGSSAGGSSAGGSSAGGSATGGSETGPGGSQNGCTPLPGPFERRELTPFPGSGPGTCGCETDEACVATRVMIDEVTETTLNECVKVPTACDDDRSCCCFAPCESDLECSPANMPGVLQCRAPM